MDARTFNLYLLEHSLPVIVSLDPGKSGAFTVITGTYFAGEAKIAISRDFKELWHPPSYAILSRLPKHFAAVIENVHSMPKQGVKSMFTFGQWYGYQQALLVPYTDNIHYMEPQVWQRKIRTTFPGQGFAEVAAQLFPAMASAFLKRKKDHNTVDAALIGVAYALGAKPTRSISELNRPRYCAPTA